MPAGPPLAGSAPSAPSAAPGARTLALAGHWYLDTPAPGGTSAGPPVGGLLVGTQSSAADGPDLRMSWMTTRCRLGGSLRLTPSADGAGAFVVGAPSPDPAAAGGCTPDPAEVVVRDALAAARGLRLADDRLVVLGPGGAVRATFRDTPPTRTPLTAGRALDAPPSGTAGRWTVLAVRWWPPRDQPRDASTGLVLRADPSRSDHVFVTLDGSCRSVDLGLMSSGAVATRADRTDATCARVPLSSTAAAEAAALEVALDLTSGVLPAADGTLTLLDRHGEPLIALGRPR